MRSSPGQGYLRCDSVINFHDSWSPQKRRACWVTRQLKKESRRGNADDSSQQTSTAEGTHLLSLAATICTILQGTSPRWEMLLTPVGAFICFCDHFADYSLCLLHQFAEIGFLHDDDGDHHHHSYFLHHHYHPLLLTLHNCFPLCQSSIIFLHHSNASATADHRVKEWKQRISAPVGKQLQTAILYEWCCKSAPGRDSASLFCIKTHASCQIRPGSWCFHVCNWAGHLSTGHICDEPYHHRKAQVYDSFESESFWIFCRKERIVFGEKKNEVNHDQSSRPQK